MTAAADAGDVDAPAARLAAPLLRLAARVLDDVPPHGLLDAVGPLRDFAEEPSAARYLAATRALRAAHRRHKLSLLGQAVGTRRTEQGLDTLARGGGLSPELIDALRALPIEARNGRRLAIIADLLAAHRLIDARASGGLRALLRSLGPMPRLSADRRRRRRADR